MTKDTAATLSAELPSRSNTLGTINLWNRADQCFAIQPAIWPERGISTELLPYFELSGPAGHVFPEDATPEGKDSRSGIIFALGGRAALDGFFNLFNLGKWRSYCDDIPLGLQLQGKGRFHLCVTLAIHDRSMERVFSADVTLDGGDTIIPLDLSAYSHPRMLLFFELVALEDGHLRDFAWITPAPPRQMPHLMISITSFRREAAVSATMDRFARFRAGSPIRDNLRLLVVDNGQTLEPRTGDGVTLVHNANLGGAGGFARGLIEARASGASHCLFMDDDASIHMGAITRAYMFLAYAKDANTAVAGAMIDAEHRWRLWENGASFYLGCRAHYFGCDLRERRYGLRFGHEHTDSSFRKNRMGLRQKFDPSSAILEGYSGMMEMEFLTTPPPAEIFYAGWWFFAFPVNHPRHMPFPFFVRGDDVSFSLANDLQSITLPGVVSFQESFTDKASPLTWYLDLRSHLAHHLSISFIEVPWIKLMRMVFSFYRRTAMRFHYESLSAVNLAIEDVLAGPDFFARNADMGERRTFLKNLTVTEAWKPVEKPIYPHNRLPPRIVRMLLLLTLNGHLLPLSGLFFRRKCVIASREREDFRQVYGARRITYLNSDRTQHYTVTYNGRRFWAESLRLLRNCLTLRRRYGQLKADWRSGYDRLTTEGFWNEKLGLGPASDTGTAAPRTDEVARPDPQTAA